MAGALSLVAIDASACSTAAWIQDGGTSGVVGAPLAASPNSAPTAVSRYAGLCGLQASAANNFVRDGSPSAEATYRARFYVRAASGDGTLVFRARNASNADMITVTSNAAGFSFTTSGGTASSAAITAGRWYSIELNWAAGAAMTATVQGNGAAAPLATVTLPGVSNAADRIDFAELGWISGGTTGSVQVDAFESRRTTAIGRLCRGNANVAGGSANTRDIFDVQTVINEINQVSLSPGQPDSTENGVVDIFDIQSVINFINTSPACT
jgi:hypothetical protein